MGAVGALALAILHRRLTWKLLKEGMDTTLKLTTMVMFILVGSTVFSLTFRGVDGDLWIEGMLSNLPGGVVGFLVFVNVFVFFLAFFLDYFEIAFIIIPLLAPVAQKMGIDLIWFGVLIGVNMQTSFMHPPFGFALFYLRSVAPPSIKSEDILWGSIPWVIIMLIMVALVILFPGMVALSIQIFGRFVGTLQLAVRGAVVIAGAQALRRRRLDRVLDVDLAGLLELQRGFDLLALFERLLQSREHHVKRSRLELDGLAGLDLEPASPPAASLRRPAPSPCCGPRSALAAAVEPPTRRSGAVPLLVMVM